MHDPDRNMETDSDSITGIGSGTSTLIRRMSWLGDRGTLGVEESPDFTEQGDC